MTFWSTLARSAVAALFAAPLAFAQPPASHPHSFGDAEKWAQVYARDWRTWSINPGGRVAIIDFRLDSPDGPPPKARIAPERVKAEMKKAGYVLIAEHAFLPRQYFLVFRGASM